MKKCGEFLKKCREAQGLSQREVSTSLGYNTSQFISNWERGLSQPPIPSLRKLAKMYKIDPDTLFNVILEAQVDLVRRTLRQKFVDEYARTAKEKKAINSLF